jgi:hypothetical protein
MTSFEMFCIYMAKCDIEFDVQVRCNNAIPMYTIQIHNGAAEGYYINKDLQKLIVGLLHDL